MKRFLSTQYIVGAILLFTFAAYGVADRIERGGLKVVGSITNSALTASTVPYANASKVITSSAVTTTELGYLSGVTSAIQTQLGTKLGTSVLIDNRLIRADGTASIQTSGITVSDTDAVTGVLSLNASGTVTAGSFSGPLTGAVTGNLTGDVTGTVSGNAGTATALAANPADCGADTYATTIAASGALTCATVTNAGLAGSIAFSKHSAMTADRILASDVSGFVSVTSIAKTNLPKVTAANINYSAGVPAVTNEYGGDWISSITDTGSGQASLVTQGFTTSPACVCTSKEAAVSGSSCMITSTSTTSVPVRLRDLAATLSDENFYIICTEFF